MNPSLDYARTQADGLDNIAPTTLQGQQAWQYAQSDNFLSPEEAAAVMRAQLEPHRQQLLQTLSEVGYSAGNLAKYPDIEQALFSGQSTKPLTILVGPEVTMRGTLRIVLTPEGPDIRITPTQRELTIPNAINGVQLSKQEQRTLTDTGELSRPVLMAENGNYLPTYLRVDKDTNKVELWRVKTEDMPTKLLGIDLTKDQQQMLATGNPVRLAGLLDRQGEPFNATVSLSPAKQSLTLTDFNRLDVVFRPDNAFRNQVTQNNEGAKTDVTQGREVASKTTTATNKQSESLLDKLIKTETNEPEQGRRMRH